MDDKRQIVTAVNITHDIKFTNDNQNQNNRANKWTGNNETQQWFDWNWFAKPLSLLKIDILVCLMSHVVLSSIVLAVSTKKVYKQGNGEVVKGFACQFNLNKETQW